MKLTLAATLLFAAVLPAASWDGAKGPFNIATFTFSSGTGTNLPGVPIISGPLVWHTTIFIACSDPHVSALRARIFYRDETGDHVTSILAEFVEGYGGVTVTIPLHQIVDVKFSELLEGFTH